MGRVIISTGRKDKTLYVKTPLQPCFAMFASSKEFRLCYLIILDYCSLLLYSLRQLTVYRSWRLFTDLLMLRSPDVSTDGIWCYIILWVTPRSRSHVVRWGNLKERLLSICPPLVPSFYLYQPLPCSSSSPVYLLKFCSLDQKGLLHGIKN